MIRLGPELDDSPFLPGLQQALWGRGHSAVCGVGGGKLPKCVCVPSRAATRQPEARSDSRETRAPRKAPGESKAQTCACRRNQAECNESPVSAARSGLSGLKPGGGVLAARAGGWGGTRGSSGDSGPVPGSLITAELGQERLLHRQTDGAGPRSAGHIGTRQARPGAPRVPHAWSPPSAQRSAWGGVLAGSHRGRRPACVRALGRGLWLHPLSALTTHSQGSGPGLCEAGYRSPARPPRPLWPPQHRAAACRRGAGPRPRSLSSAASFLRRPWGSSQTPRLAPRASPPSPRPALPLGLRRRCFSVFLRPHPRGCCAPGAEAAPRGGLRPRWAPTGLRGCEGLPVRGRG